MSDIVFIRGLEARGIIGVNDWEREKPQTIRIDIDMSCDTRAAAENDDLDKTVNYRGVAKAVLRHIEESAHLLVETLADRIATMILEDHGVAWTRVRVSKPGAVRFSDEVGVEIERGTRPPFPA